MNAFALFDRIADAYDRSYDAPEGRAIFREEIRWLQALCGDWSGRWLEVGVGTGWFAATHGIPHGLDVSRKMGAAAAGRGVQVQIGLAEQMPFRSHSFDGVLMVLTLCSFPREA
jgi:ubiquinone/menaquinone biosynthesis C-methylase UbiE